MKKKGFNHHHVIPRSRVKDKGLLKTVLTPAKEHNLYHQLVGNMTPIEAFKYFNETFWDKEFIMEGGED